MTGKSAQSYINQYLKENTKISATDLCQHLITNHGFSSDAYSTGRPKLYVDVVKYLENLQKNGHLDALEKNQENCKYKVLTVEIPDDSHKGSDKIEEDDNKNDDYEDLQMTLF